MTQPDPSAQSGAPDLAGQSAGTVGDGTAVSPEGGQSATVTPPEPTATVSADEFKRLQTQLQAADKKRDQAERELQAIRDKDLPEIERLKRDAEALVDTNARLTTKLKDQAVELAFLRDNKVRWKDSAAALKLLDRSAIVIDDDGNVEGVKLASEKLAKQYPWMVDDAAPAAGAGGAPAAPASAPPMNGKPNPDNGSSGALLKRLPALGSRRRPGS